MKGPRKARSKALDECRQKLTRLEEENEALRQTAAVTGGLAERLNHALRDERRRDSDRRQRRRNAGEGRASAPGRERGPEADD